MAAEFGNGWGDGSDLLSPAETLPDPSNPWASCAGDGGAQPVKPDIELPDFAEEGGIVIGGWGVRTGEILLAAGTGIVTGALMIIFSLIETASVAWVAALSPWIGAVAVGMLAVGILVLIAAIVALLAGIDPPVLDFRRKVAPPSRRRVALPADMPRPLQELLAHLVEIERLSHGEIDLIDSARTAAAAKDADWYDTHVRDLHLVQSLKTKHVQQAGHSIRDFADRLRTDLGELKFDPDVPLRERSNPILSLRRELNEIGITDSDLTHVIALTRSHSETQSAIEKGIGDFGKRFDNDALRVLEHVAERWESADLLDHEAFGSSPKTASGAAKPDPGADPTCDPPTGDR